MSINSDDRSPRAPLPGAALDCEMYSPAGILRSPRHRDNWMWAHALRHDARLDRILCRWTRFDALPAWRVDPKVVSESAQSLCDNPHKRGRRGRRALDRNRRAREEVAQ